MEERTQTRLDRNSSLFFAFLLPSSLVRGAARCSSLNQNTAGGYHLLRFLRRLTSNKFEIADLICRGAVTQNPECWDLAVKGSSDSEPCRGAGEAKGERGEWVQKKRPTPRRPFSSRFARARVSVRARCRAQAGAVCVHMFLSCQLAASCPGVTCVGENAGLFSGVC